MFEHATSLVLIAAVSTCPLLCGTGICHTGRTCHVCDGQDSWTALCPLQGTVGCAHKGSSQERRGNAPCGCPNKKICQGVCGGAVFEKLCKLDRPETSVVLPQIDSRTPLASLMAQGWAVQAEQISQSVFAKNQGRYLRMLHSSFLC